MRAETVAALALALGACAGAEDATALRVALAANFTAAHEVLAADFTARTGVPVVASPGSSGQLFAQITNGAPFDVFLSADQARPEALERDGWAVAGTRFTYAEGRLVLFGPGLAPLEGEGKPLSAPDVRVVIANPETAPYGRAGRETLVALGLEEVVADRLVRGESVAHSLSFVRSGAAEMGFVALAQVIEEAPATYWVVPAELYAPILQDAVLLRDAMHPRAGEYLEYLASAEAAETIERFGYSVPGRGSTAAGSSTEGGPGGGD